MLDPRDSLRVTLLHIDADSQRALAGRRRRAALLALPVFAGLTVAALAVSLKLMLLAVVGGFMSYACVVLANQADRAGRSARDQALAVIGADLQDPPRRVQVGVFRRDHVRLILADGSLDVPLTPTQRDTLADALRRAGVRVELEGPLRRALTLLVAPLVALLVLVIVKVALGVTAVLSLAAWPWTVGVLLAVLLAAWLVRRAR